MQEPTDSNKQLTIAMILSMVLWGISWPANSVLTKFGGPVTLGVFRYGFVIISLLILLIALKVKIKISKKALPFLLISGCLMAVYNYTFLKGLQTGSPGAGGILVTTLNPIMAYGLGMLIDWKKPTFNERIGLILGIVAGCCLLQLWEQIDIFANPGNSFFLLSAFLWSVMSKFTSKASRYGAPFSFSLWMYVITLLFILPFADWTEFAQLTHSTDIRFWGNVLFSSVIVTTLATTIYFYATAKIGAEKASSFIFTVPFTAALTSWAILGETIELHTIVGGLFGIGAVYMINKKRVETVNEEVK